MARARIRLASSSPMNSSLAVSHHRPAGRSVKRPGTEENLVAGLARLREQLAAP